MSMSTSLQEEMSVSSDAELDEFCQVSSLRQIFSGRDASGMTKALLDRHCWPSLLDGKN